VQLLSLHYHRPGVVPVDAEDRPCDLTAPRSDQPGQGDDLPSPHVQRDIDEHAFPGQVLNLQDMITGQAALPGRPLHHLPAHHRPHEIIRGEAGQFPGEHVPAVAHHGHPLANHEDFLQAVRRV